ncbi:hypothetical protein B9L20_16630 [Serratia marcescens]|nr:hypothetical protein B9L20_16630 [Serratia marcescens]
MPLALLPTQSNRNYLLQITQKTQRLQKLAPQNQPKLQNHMQKYHNQQLVHIQAKRPLRMLLIKARKRELISLSGVLLMVTFGLSAIKT